MSDENKQEKALDDLVKQAEEDGEYNSVTSSEEDKVWLKYPHIERLDTEEVEGILSLPQIWVEPKIDGANATVLLDKDGILRAAKRSQVLGNNTDFRGLVPFVYRNQDKFMAFFAKYPKHLIYGEWLVPHTIKSYRADAWNTFYGFDILNLETHNFYTPEQRMNMLAEFEITQVVPLCKYEGPIISEEHLKRLENLVNTNKFLIDDPNLFGEGIVIKSFTADNLPYRNKYGRTTWAKIVRQEFKEKNVIAMGICDKKLPQEWEMKFSDEFVTPARVEKLKQKILDDKGTGWQSKYIAEILGRMYYDVFTEELFRFVSKNRVPSINFKVLQQYVTYKTKQILGV